MTWWYKSSWVQTVDGGRAKVEHVAGLQNYVITITSLIEREFWQACDGRGILEGS